MIIPTTYASDFDDGGKLKEEIADFIAKPKRIHGKHYFQKIISQSYSNFLNTKTSLSFEPSNRPKVSVIIVTYRKAEFSFACLYSLATQLRGQIDPIIINNGTDTETDMLLERLKGVRIIQNPSNSGYIEACHQGSALGRARSLLFLNNDTFLMGDVLKDALVRLDMPSVGIVGGKILLPNGRLQEAGGKLLRSGHTRGIGRGRLPSMSAFNRSAIVDYVSGAFLLTHANLWGRLEGYDRLFHPGYYEDVDFCLRAKRLGYVTVYEPKVEIIHFEHASSSKKYARAQINKNRSLFLQKHFRT